MLLESERVPTSATHFSDWETHHIESQLLSKVAILSADILVIISSKEWSTSMSGHWFLVMTFSECLRPPTIRSLIFLLSKLGISWEVPEGKLVPEGKIVLLRG
jgi:hypothetical protein